MSHTTLCCLCVSSSTGFKALFDDSGQPNEIYKVAVKYFDSILLNPKCKHPPNVICMECWQHIEDFHRFQLLVINSQTRLESQQPILCLTRLEDDIFNNINDALGKQTFASSVTVFDSQIDDLSSDKQLNSVTTIFQQPFVDSSMLQQVSSNSRLEDEILIEDFNNYKQPSLASELSSDIMPIDDIPTNTHLDSNSVPPPTNSISVFELIQIDDELPKIPSSCNPNDRRRKTEIDKFIAKWKGALKCNECKKKFVTYTLLTKHYRLEHQGMKCYTICCGKKIKDRSKLIKHIQKFHMSKQLKLKKCKFCKATFGNAEKLRYHIVTECRKDKITFSCNICPEVFSKESYFREHRLRHKDKHICPYCNKILSTRYTLEHHKKKIHPEETSTREVNTQLSTKFTLDEKGKNNEKNRFVNLNDTPQTNINDDNLQKEFLTDDEEEFHNKQPALPKLIYFSKPTQNNQANTPCSIKPTTTDKIQKKRANVKYVPTVIVPEIEQSESHTSVYQENNNTEDLTPDMLAKTCCRSAANKLKYDAFIRKIKGDLECPKCPKEMFKDFTMLSKHFSIKHENEVAFITCCNFKLITRHNICVHLCLHLNPNAYQCDVCKICFSNYWKLKAHKRYKHEGERHCVIHRKSHRELASEIYDRSVCCKRKELFFEHNDYIAKSKGELECRLCKAKFAYFSMLEHHFQCEHPKEEFYLECCSRKWKKLSIASRHMIKHSKKRYEYLCEICKSYFQYKETLNKHIGKYHNKSIC